MPEFMRFCERRIFDWIAGIIALAVLLFIGSAVFVIAAGGLPGFWNNLKSEEVRFAFRMSLMTATLSTVIVMILALPTAYALTRTGMPMKGAFSLLIELVLSVPYILLGLSLLVIFSSPMGKQLKEWGFPVVFSPAGIVMAHLLVNLPYAVRLLKTAFEASDRRQEFIAQTLGASPFQCFLTILIPSCRNSLISTFILSWSRGMGEFGATLMLVGVTRMKTETLPGSIYLSISTGNNEAAMSTAMLMLLISGFAMILVRAAEQSGRRRIREVREDRWK